MGRFTGGFWGPRPRWALVPLAAVGTILGWVALQQTADVGGPQPITVLKPIAAGDENGDQAGKAPPPGTTAPPGPMPIEVRYGVPSPRTARLWSEPLPG